MISTLEDQLSDAEAELAKAEEQIEENLELSKNRIRSAYEQGDAVPCWKFWRSQRVFMTL